MTLGHAASFVYDARGVARWAGYATSHGRETRHATSLQEGDNGHGESVKCVAESVCREFVTQRARSLCVLCVIVFADFAVKVGDTGI